MRRIDIEQKQRRRIGTLLPIDPAIRSIVSPEGVVLLHIQRGYFFRANHVGARIWQRLSCGVPLDTTIDEIATEFSTPREVVADDVLQFVASLIEQGFLQLQGD